MDKIKLTVLEYSLQAGFSDSYVRRCIRENKINKLPGVIQTEKHGRAYVVYMRENPIKQ